MLPKPSRRCAAPSCSRGDGNAAHRDHAHWRRRPRYTANQRAPLASRRLHHHRSEHRAGPSPTFRLRAHHKAALQHDKPPHEIQHSISYELNDATAARLLSRIAAHADETLQRPQCPFPDEHRDEHTATGVTHHLRWIPETGPDRYVTGGSALNLRQPSLGEAGDWHQTGWWIPDGVEDVQAHFADTNDDPAWATELRELAPVLGTLEIVDCRPALRDLDHPAGYRNAPVWCATHVRATLEQAWWMMRQWDGDEAELTLEPTDPSTIARRLATREQWVQLHRLGDRIARTVAVEHRLKDGWSEWLSHQTPLADYMDPNARWNLAALDALAANNANE